MIRTCAVLALAAALAACASRPVAPAEGHGAALAPTVAPPAPALPPDARARFLDDALAMLGHPYRYGGDTPAGFDCSGLVYFAAHEAGVDLPRTTGEQLRAGTPVAQGDLRPGDLVFMRFPHKSLHVGIMLGREHFLHAPASGQSVRVDSLTEPAFARAYLGARRPEFPAAGSPR